MRIAKVSSTFLPGVGGVEWKVHYLATELARLGHDVTIFTSHPNPRKAEVMRLPEQPYNVIRCCSSSKGFGRFGVTEWLFKRAFLRSHAANGFDLVHTHHLGIATRVGLAVKCMTGLPVVATTCGSDIQVNEAMGYGFRLKPRNDRMVRRNLKGVDVVGSVSSSIRQELEDLGTTAEIVDIPNGVDWDAFQLGQEGYFLRQFGIDAESTVVVSLGRNHPIKGYAQGIRAMAKVLQSRPNVHYFLFGRGIENLAPLVSSLGVEDRVHLSRSVPMDEVPSVLKSADIYFNPSVLEGFSQANVQALACGLPLVVTDVPGNRDVARLGCALVAKVNDTGSMAEALGRLIDDRSLREDYGAKGHQASRNYSWGKVTEQYADVYSRILLN
jgi:glycosyltransferase involved in cell wall biosynthesis